MRIEDIDIDTAVDQMVELLGERKSCTFIDDGGETWEVKVSSNGLAFALCPSREAFLCIEPNKQG